LAIDERRVTRPAEVTACGVGLWRDRDNGVAVADSGELVGGDLAGPFTAARHPNDVGLTERSVSSAEPSIRVTEQSDVVDPEIESFERVRLKPDTVDT
jgi:hypothetical protein